MTATAETTTARKLHLETQRTSWREDGAEFTRTIPGDVRLTVRTCAACGSWAWIARPSRDGAAVLAASDGHTDPHRARLAADFWALSAL